MSKKRNPYSTRLNDDSDTRLQIALMRMVGCSATEIARETGRHIKTIEVEIKRVEHKSILHDCLSMFSRKVKFPKEKWEVIEKYLQEQQA